MPIALRIVPRPGHLSSRKNAHGHIIATIGRSDRGHRANHPEGPTPNAASSSASPLAVTTTSVRPADVAADGSSRCIVSERWWWPLTPIGIATQVASAPDQWQPGDRNSTIGIAVAARALRAATTPRRRKRDELAPFQPSELHPMPQPSPGQHTALVRIDQEGCCTAAILIRPGQLRKYRCIVMNCRFGAKTGLMHRSKNSERFRRRSIVKSVTDLVPDAYYYLLQGATTCARTQRECQAWDKPLAKSGFDTPKPILNGLPSP
jgi:hypothetical protein